MRNHLNSVAARLVGVLAVVVCCQSALAATVYYAAATSSGTGDGSSWANRMAWTDAYTAARAVSGDAEIRLTGDVAISSIQDTQTIANNLTIRGGFDADDETRPEKRYPTDAKSTFTANDAYDLFPVNVTGTLTFENILFTHAKAHAISKSGAGPIYIRDCSISQNGRATGHNGSCTGAGLYVTGAGVVTVSNTLIAGNGPISYPENSGGGWGIYLSKALRAYIDDCQFVTNSTKLGTQSDQYSGKHYGAAIRSDGVPVTVRNCRFAGNTPRCGQTAGSGGVVYLGGTCGGSAFTNCVFVGNQELLGHNVCDGGGIFRISLKNVGDTVGFSNCLTVTCSRLSA